MFLVLSVPGRDRGVEPGGETPAALHAGLGHPAGKQANTGTAARKQRCLESLRIKAVI